MGLGFGPLLLLLARAQLRLVCPKVQGFRVQGSEFQGTGFRVSGYRVQGFRVHGFRVQGSGFRVQGSGFRVQGSGFRVQGSGFGVNLEEGGLALAHLQQLHRHALPVAPDRDLRTILKLSRWVSVASPSTLEQKRALPVPPARGLFELTVSALSCSKVDKFVPEIQRDNLRIDRIFSCFTATLSPCLLHGGYLSSPFWCARAHFCSKVDGLVPQTQRVNLSIVRLGYTCFEFRVSGHPGGNPGANLKSISHRCHPILVAVVWELTK